MVGLTLSLQLHLIRHRMGQARRQRLADGAVGCGRRARFRDHFQDAEIAMGTFFSLILCALVCAPSLFAISSAVRSNRAGKPRSRAINVMLVATVLIGTVCGMALRVFGAVFLQVKTFVTLTGGLLCILVSIMPLFITYWSLRALNGAERWPGAA